MSGNLEPIPQLKVLLVEDDEDDYILTADLLRRAHEISCDLTWVDTYELAMEKLLTGNFDVCLLDLQLGPHNGLELLRDARARGVRTAVVILTGGRLGESDVASIRAGASDYVEKPDCTPKLLQQSIRHALERTRAEHERLEVEARAQVQHIESIGALAGGVAHELNNILNMILVDIELAVEELNDDQSELADNLLEVRQAAQRGASVTKKLLGFGQRVRLEPEVLDLREFVNSLTHTLKGLTSQDLVWKVNAAPHCIVRADRGSLRQILINLITNARDAMSDDGRIEISIRQSVLTDSDCHNRPDWRAGSFVKLGIRDIGSGMTPETVTRMFEPFFTTKGAGTGSGLGLAMVFGLVKQQGGFIEVESQVGQGTHITTYFPLVSAAPKRQQEHKARPNTARSRADVTVLVVEDETPLRKAAEKVLKRAGYTVLAAADGPDALDVLAEYEGVVDLMVTDVVMPNMGGVELYERARRMGSVAKVLFVSGYSASDLYNSKLLEPGLPLLQKPWTIDELLSRVTRALGTDRMRLERAAS